jgi:tRNA 2-thiocytidine biosynthesis protein TtcA
LSRFPDFSPKTARRLAVFAKKVGRGINRFRMIEPDDRLLIGVSGGKDSLALCVALAQRMAWVPVRYECQALIIDWNEQPIAPSCLDKVRGFLDGWGIPLAVVSTSFYAMSHHKPFNCYICSRNRKRILFREAQRRGIRKIALGHHRDDIIETTLMNLFLRGEFSTMMPVQSFFGGKMQIIRPMCEVDERDIDRLSRVIELPAFSVDCPRKDESQRLLFKDIIQRVRRVNRHAKENLYNAPWRINPAYLPTSLTPPTAPTARTLPEPADPEYSTEA